MSVGRKAALTAIEKCRRAGAWSDAVISSVMESAELDVRERGFAAALCYGVFQNLYLLDHYINFYCNFKLEPKVLDILRISAYQILFMDRVPDSAAVNEAVKLCKNLGYARASGLVNAVLRKISVNKMQVPVIKGNAAQKLSVIYSCPLWLVEYYISILGFKSAEQLLKAQNAPTQVTIQVNTVKCDRQELLDRFISAGLSAKAHSYLNDCILLENGGSIEKLPGFEAGLFYIQDAAAKISVIAAGIKGGMKVLDVCAAPGGKSFAAAVCSDAKAEITSCDINANKLKRIQTSAKRLGFDNINTFAADGRSYAKQWDRGFDVVLCDVPCSGLGVIRKKPDIRYKNPDEFKALPQIQLDILKNSSRYVKPEGVLIYSTCTVRKEENELLVQQFLAETSSFAAEAFRLPNGKVAFDGCYQFWPHIDDTDGFFVCKLRRIK